MLNITLKNVSTSFGHLQPVRPNYNVMNIMNTMTKNMQIV